MSSTLETKPELPTVAPADLQKPSLGNKARSAVIWNTGFNLFRDFLQFGVMLVLVRLLPPEAYGKFGLVNSIIGFMAIFSFNNFVAHTLQIKDDKDVCYQDHFTAGAILNGAMFLLTNAVAFALRWFESYAPVAPLVHAMSVTFLLEWPCEFRRKMLERQFDWKRMRLLHASGLIISSLLAIAMAWLGTGVYALLIPGMLVTLPFIYDLFVAQGWRPEWNWSLANYRQALHFGVARIGSGLSANGRQLAESSILAGVLGFAGLGILNRSFGLAQMFCQKFASQLMFAIYPVLTRLNVDAQERVGGLVLRLVAWVVIPIAFLFGMLAVPVIHAVYGAKWMEVAPLLPWTMAWGALAAITHAAYMLLLSKEKPRLCFLADLALLGGTGIALGLASSNGVVFYLAGIVGAQLTILVILLFWLSKFGVTSPRGIVDAFLPAILSAVLAYAAVLVYSSFLKSKDMTFNLACCIGAIFVLGYAGVLRCCFASLLGELINYLPYAKRLRRILIMKAAV